MISMAELEKQHPSQPSSPLQPPPQSSPDLAPPPPARSDEPPASALPRFDPSRSIIRRKALIKDLAGVYHAECLSICQELLELQRECEESYAEMKTAPPEDEDGIRRKKGGMTMTTTTTTRNKRGLKRSR